MSGKTYIPKRKLDKKEEKYRMQFKIILCLADDKIKNLIQRKLQEITDCRL